jgi:hypothetical protein
MRKLIPLTLAGVVLALAACSREDRADTANDTEAAASRVGAEIRDAANSPELKEMGAEIKDAAGDVGTVLKDTAKGAAEGAREGAAKVEAETDGHKEADNAKH